MSHQFEMEGFEDLRGVIPGWGFADGLGFG